MGTFKNKLRTAALVASVAALVCASWACNLPVEPEPDAPSDCEITVDGMYDLILGLELPEHFDAWDQEAVRNGTEFDVNQYFDILTSLSMEPGYTLDYVYDAYGGNGYPVLYTRADGMQRYATFSEYQQAADGLAGEDAQALLQQGYLAHVIPEDTEDGYFQMAVLYLLGEQFYLLWHANYDDDIIVCDQDHLEKALEDYVMWIVEYDPGDAEDILEGVEDVSLEPEVLLREDVAEVSLVYFTKWGGVYRVTYEISREKPYPIVETNLENLYEYDCGIMF
jgi:hypothetical protein